MVINLSLYKSAKKYSMKYILTAVLIILVAGCNQPDSKKKKNEPAIQVQDSLISKPNLENDSIVGIADSAALMNASTKILSALKTKDFNSLSSFIHPSSGIRFSPYGHIDTIRQQQFSAKELLTISQQRKILNWGDYDGSGEPITLTINTYFDKFVYDADFLNAEKKAVNKFLGSGNSLNNLKEIYPKANFTEFYFSGFDPKYSGMDWKTLRLVFEIENNQPWLIAIIHDQWTI